MKILYKLLLVALTMLIALPSVALAEETTRFRMETVNVGKQQQVKVVAQNAKDLFAFELRFTFEPTSLKLSNVKSGIQGFAVPPIIDDNKLRLGHTQIGEAPGKHGDVTLVVLTFDRINHGETSITLDEAKLVDSKLVAAAYHPHLQIILKDVSHRILTDIEGHWAELSIRKAVELGFVTGYRDGTFRPQQQVTRAEFTAMLVRALKLPANTEEIGLFIDLEAIPKWAQVYVNTAAKAQLVNGYADGSFRANNKMTRIEMTAIAVRALDGDGNRTTAMPEFMDYDQIPAWGQSYAAIAVKSGLLFGRTDHRLAPNAAATRAEAVLMMLRILERADQI